MEKETLAGDKEEEKKQDKKGGDRKSKGGGKDQDEKKKKSNGNGNGNGESKIKQMFSEPAPFYITFVVALVKVVFFLYDIVSYIPFQLFANPEQKLRKSERVKAAPVDMNDPSSPWRHVDALDHLEHLVFPKCTTLDQTWREAVVRHGDADALGTREVIKVHKQKQENGRVFEKLEMGEYHWSSYEKVEEVVQAVACGLLDIGHKKTENLVIFADTREEWLETALACFRTGIPVVTVYATLGEEAIAFAINESDATTVVTTHALLPKITAITKDCKSLTRVIYFSNPDPEADEPKIEKTLKDRCQLVISFDDLIERGEDSDQTEFESPKPDDLAVIMYTSGSTGNPKGVMISHKNILAALSGQGAVVSVSESDTVVAYLPLAHILELCVELISLTQGCRVGYSSALTLYDRGSKIQKGTKGDCYALRPTLMACVPAVMDRIFKAVTEEVSQGPAITRELFRVAYERKRARYEDGYNSLVLNTIAFKRIRNLLGGNLRLVLSGGAPLNAETQRFMNICFCCPVIQGYGLTETCGGGTLAEVFDLSTGSVGPPLRCCEIMLREWKDAGYSPNNEVPQGEILISGWNVALGYYKNEKKTNEDFIKLNGKRWFASGDIGEFRSDGSLRIIDRKKDLLKLAHGEYISLGKVETALLTNPHIDNICVYGDSQHDYLVALVVPNQKKLQELASQNNISDGDFEKLCENSEVNEALLKELQNHAKSKLQKSEMPQKIHICSEPWTTASGLLTEALKLKRKNIENEYKKTLEKLYGGDSKDEKPKKK